MNVKDLRNLLDNEDSIPDDVDVYVAYSGDSWGLGHEEKVHTIRYEAKLKDNEWTRKLILDVRA